MSETEKPPAKICDTAPIEVQLVEGEQYAFCPCGLSQKQPFCDSSHKGTGWRSHKFIAEKTGPAWLCMCKQTKNPPFCDGSHSAIDA